MCGGARHEGEPTGHRFQTFWHGAELSPFEQLSLRSFLDHGHEIVLFAYDRPRGVPAGVTVESAETVLPRSERFVLRGYDSQRGFVAFPNLFRFELLLQRGGWWVDLDVVCLRSEIPAPETFFALEQVIGERYEMGSAVLRFPASHPLMRRCADECRRLSKELRSRPGAGRGAFGLLGVNVIERMTAELGLCNAAAGPELCYPVHWSEAARLLEPESAASLRNRTAEAWMVHFWNSRLCALRIDKWRLPPRGSYLRDLFARHGIEVPRRAVWRRLLAVARRALARA